ncbi:NAD(P)-dependent oxidoreductase [Herbivorax sp. ANBcel31]|uniref:NAD(P)-dependent oxidoreductase n=1 Tax=Herbivorax sp. ANBcel31 TaxID=3069754 RepID=UPI0027B84663|nr:NAD(P)-dependent oxidoreductase [Herbivorax sp. ANBcel31]MDQ2085920.1 NAD(P)-dependent oxidoreductase [Herbivorax sp. ANBcel31]
MNENVLKICNIMLSKYLKTELFRNVRFIIVQHILDDTYEFIQSLTSVGSEIFCLIAKPYSINRKIYNTIINEGIRIQKLNELVNSNKKMLISTLDEAIQMSKTDNKKIIILDLGGEFAFHLNSIRSNELIGIIEDTAYGYKKYQVKLINSIPIFSVAKSFLKEIEAKFVGNAVVDSLENVLKSTGKTLCGRNALVIGYGMIGKNVAHSLKKRECNVSVLDIKSIKQLQAHFDGFITGTRKKILEHTDIIIGATGTQSISLSDILNCKGYIYLASASSKNIEIDLEKIKFNAYTERKISKNINLYILNKKRVYIINNGNPVNFLIDSVPNEIIDLVFSEILCACNILLDKKINDNSKISCVEDKYLEIISQMYLEQIKGV